MKQNVTGSIPRGQAGEKTRKLLGKNFYNEFSLSGLVCFINQSNCRQEKGPLKTAFEEASNRSIIFFFTLNWENLWRILASLLASEFDSFADSTADVKELTRHQYQRATRRTH